MRKRISQCFVLAIEWKYVKTIFERKKRYEFRRKKFAKKGDVIIVYAKQPKGKVVAVFDVNGRISRPLNELWEITEKYAGMKEPRFKKYFHDLDEGNAIKIGKIRRFREELDLKKVLGLSPQQLQGLGPIAKSEHDRLISEYEYDEI
jgi:predicted transcriptional regulator